MQMTNIATSSSSGQNSQCFSISLVVFQLSTGLSKPTQYRYKLLKTIQFFLSFPQVAESSSPELSERPTSKNKTNGITPKQEKKQEKLDKKQEKQEKKLEKQEKKQDKQKTDKKADEKEKEKEKVAEKRQEKPQIKEPPPKLPRIGDYDIPIFTEEFLEHNKAVDTELRLLRKSNTDYEQQNSVLEKHVENIRNGISKLENETCALQENNQLLQTYLAKLRKKLTTAFAGLSIPGESEPCNLQNVDKYMNALHQMAANAHGPASLNKAKDIVRKLDLQIQL